MHQPTERVIKVLKLITQEQNGIGLSDLGRAIDVPRSTLLPILQTLCQYQYLRQDENGKYQAGTELFCIGNALAGCFPLRKYVHEQLQELVKQLGETCYCGVLDAGNVLYIDKVDSPQPLRMLTNTGKRLPAYATGLGKALLAEKSRQELETIYPNGLRPLTAQTITHMDTLEQQLQQVRKDGYAWEVEESTEHIRCFAVPIYKNGRITAAISVTNPIFRYREEDRERILKALKHCAQKIGQIMEKTDAHFGDLF